LAILRNGKRSSRLSKNPEQNSLGVYTNFAPRVLTYKSGFAWTYENGFTRTRERSFVGNWRSFSVLLCLAACLAGAAWAGVPPDPLENPGFQHFYNLEYDDALAAFMAQSGREPESPDIYNHIAQTIVFRQMLRSGVLGSDLINSANYFLTGPKLNFSAADQNQFGAAVARAVALAEQRVKKDGSDVAALYSLGVSHAVRANYEFMVKKWGDALGDASAARKLHTRVLELDSKFIDARLIPGADEYVIGSLPRVWKMLSAVAGLPGDRENGIQTLKAVAQNGRYNRFDAEALLVAIYRREKRPGEAIAPLNDLIRTFPRGYQLRVELAEMYGDLGDRKKAMDAVDQLDQLRCAGAPGFQQLPEAKVHYTRGGLWMQWNDLDQALSEIKNATANASTLDAPSAGNAWLRLGQIWDLKGQRPQAIAAYREAMRAAPDSQAADQAKSHITWRYKKPE
jgi:tetratricopeptide (TPR) repeat protein